MKAATLLTEVVQRRLPAVAAATALKDIPGWDSIVMVRLMLRLEERIGREFNEAELEAIVTVGDVERLLG